MSGTENYILIKIKEKNPLKEHIFQVIKCMKPAHINIRINSLD